MAKISGTVIFFIKLGFIGFISYYVEKFLGIKLWISFLILFLLLFIRRRIVNHENK